MCNSERLFVVLLLCETSQDQLPIFDARLRVTWIPLVRATWRWANENATTTKKKFWPLGFFLTVDRAIAHYSAASYFMESSSWTAIIAELETAKSACLEIMSPVVMSAEKLGKENNLLQDKISARSSAMPKQRISLCKNEWTNCKNAMC